MQDRNPPQRRRIPLLLILGTLGFWVLALAGHVALLPDRFEARALPGEVAWTGD